ERRHLTQVLQVRRALASQFQQMTEISQTCSEAVGLVQEDCQDWLSHGLSTCLLAGARSLDNNNNSNNSNSNSNSNNFGESPASPAASGGALPSSEAYAPQGAPIGSAEATSKAPLRCGLSRGTDATDLTNAVLAQEYQMLQLQSEAQSAELKSLAMRCAALEASSRGGHSPATTRPSRPGSEAGDQRPWAPR
ncbi:unnamed protein product, partial [Polarella glacialis]